MRSSPGSALPRFATELPAGTPTFGPAIERTALAFGRRLMPWQIRAADVIGATTDDGRRMLFPYVIVHVPRRAGKSAVTFASMVHRLLTGPNVQAHYTAQTREHAAKAFRKDWAPVVARSPFYASGDLTMRRSNGSEEIGVPALGSGLGLFAPGPNALHGSDADVVCVDEAWSFTLAAGAEIEAGAQPAQLTRPRRQILIVSAGGTSESAWLAHWMQLARDGTPGVAMIDYGAEPTDDVDDPAVWERVHPAVGHTIDVDGIAAMRATMPTEEFARAVCGVWTTGDGPPATIDPERWRAGEDPDAAPGGRSLTFGIERSYDGATTSIAAVSVDDAGRTVVELVEQAPGYEWVPAWWRERRARFRCRLFADSLGPTAPVVDLLRRERLPVELLTTGEYATACALVLDDVVGGRLVHRAQPALDAAAGIATARAVGDRWVWQRKGTGDVAPIIAVTVAAHGARRPASVPTSTVATG